MESSSSMILTLCSLDPTSLSNFLPTFHAKLIANSSPNIMEDVEQPKDVLNVSLLQTVIKICDVALSPENNQQQLVPIAVELGKLFRYNL